MTKQKTLSLHTRGGGSHDFTAKVERVVRASKFCAGTCNLLLQHESLAIKVRASSLASALLSIESLYFAVWVALLIVAVILQVVPVVLVAMMFSLAIGVPKEIALNVVPVVFVVVVYFSCLIASKFAGRPGAGWKTERSDPGPRTWFF